MKIIVMTLCIIFIFKIGFSQDCIYTKSGEKYEVKIISDDSLFYYITINRNDKILNTQIPKSNVKLIIYEDVSKNVAISKVPYIDSVGLIKKDFIYLNTEKLIESKKVEYKNPIIGSSYLIADSVKYDPSVIKFYKNSSGFFSNINKYMIFGENRFAERKIAGRLNIFHYVSTSYTPMSYGGSGGGMYMGGGVSKKTIKFYNKGFSDLKEMTYDNLINDLGDNPESVHYLDIYQTATNAKLGFGIAGTALIIAGAIVISNQVKAVNGGETDAQQNYGITYSLFGAGFACYGVGIVFHFKKGKYLDLAIDSYNR